MLSVFAASSLRDAFERFESDFEARNPNVDVQLHTAGSQALALQVEQGAPVDVFASADFAQIERLVRAGALPTDTTPAGTAFATGRLVLVTPRSQARVQGLEQLSEVDAIVIAADNVPAGRYTQAMLDAASDVHGSAWRDAVEGRIVSREFSVRRVRTKVELGEADAGVVYASDAWRRAALRVVEIEASLQPNVEYFVAATTNATPPDVAQRFVDFVRSEDGAQVLTAYGLGSPRAEAELRKVAP